MKKLVVLYFVNLILTCNAQFSDYIKTSDGLKMYYESHGSGSNTIVFIHGWSGSNQTWTEQVNRFKNNYTVVVIDMPGFGKSGIERKDWSMRQYGSDIELLLKRINTEKVILVGHSMGGIVALEAARILGNRIKGVITVDIMQQLPSAFDSTREINDCNDMALNYGKFLYQFNYFKDSVLTSKYISILPAGDPFPDHWKHSWMSHQQWKEKESVACVQEILVPVRAINADEIKTDTAAWKKYTQGYEVIIMPNSGHFLLWQYPENFNIHLEKLIQSIL